MPKEQVNIEIGDHKIALYNFNELLEGRHFEELKKAIEDFSEVNKSGEYLKDFKYILINDKREINSRTDEELYGLNSVYQDSVIKVNPRATESDKFRIEGVSAFEATIIHELSHLITADFVNKWAQKFNWHELKEPKKLVGDAYAYFESDNPERCISDYAKISPTEDVCESMVAALRKPELLDPEKLQFIRDELLQDSESLPVTMERREGGGVELPKLESVNYKTEKSTMKIRKRNKT